MGYVKLTLKYGARILSRIDLPSDFTKILLFFSISFGVISVAFSSGFLSNAAAQERPIPRMVSLRADEVNIRSGPGVRYPVKWVYMRKYMPVEVIAEYDTWRKIRDWEGAEGWVHQAMLSPKRAIFVTADTLTIRRQDRQNSPATARLARGMVGLIRKCNQNWCRVSVQDYDGWIERQAVWGLYENEILD